MLLYSVAVAVVLSGGGEVFSVPSAALVSLSGSLFWPLSWSLSCSLSWSLSSSFVDSLSESIWHMLEPRFKGTVTMFLKPKSVNIEVE